MTPARVPRPGDRIRHPVVVASILVLALNDQWMKEAHPGVLTGKLSDLAGLVMAPVLAVAICELVTGRVLPPKATVVAATGVGATFAVVQLWGPAGALYEHGFGLARWPLDAALAIARGGGVEAPTTVRLWPDPTDLAALPALAVGIVLHRAVPTPVPGSRHAQDLPPLQPPRARHVPPARRLRQLGI